MCDYSVGNYSAEGAAGSGVCTDNGDPQVHLHTQHDDIPLTHLRFNRAFYTQLQCHGNSVEIKYEAFLFW